jgi:protein-S-isoprenylcysteine O-methyltransferase Ste14
MSSETGSALLLPRHEGLVRIGAFFFKTRNFVFPLVYLPLILLTLPERFLGRADAEWALDAAGLLIAFSGQLLRVVVIGLKYIHRGGKNKKVHADDLVTAGIFAHCRNPLYVGNLMILTGLFMVHNNPWAYLIGLPFFAIAYLAIVAAEEQYLERKFGAQYEEYCRNVPRFAMKLEGLRATLDSVGFDWRRVIRKEYGTIFTTATMAIGLIVREQVVWSGWEEARPAVVAGCAVEAVLGIAWLMARSLKKSGALEPDRDRRA